MIRSLVRPAARVLAAAAVTAVLLAIPASTPSQAASFTFSDPNCSSFNWDGVTLSCVTTSAPAGAPSGCSISGAPGTAQVAPYNYSLTANCSSGSPTGWQWSNGSTAATQNITGSISATTMFTVVASNGSGSSSPVSKTITIGTGGSGGSGGSGGGPIACSNVPGATHVIDATWSSNGTYLTANYSGFGPNDAIVVRFTTSIITSATGKGYIRAVEFSDPIAPRTGTLSSQPCDFSNGVPVASGGGLGAAFANDTAPWLYFTLVNPKSGFATLQASTTYYFNMINAGCISGSGTCNVQIYFVKPSGS